MSYEGNNGDVKERETGTLKKFIYLFIYFVYLFLAA